MNEAIIKTCGSCKKDFSLKLLKINRYRGKSDGPVFIYSDESQKTQLGKVKRFYRKICHDCMADRKRKYQGVSKRDSCDHGATIKAVNAEKIAQKRFESLGFSVSRVDVFGPDLVCSIGDMAWSVEVKSTCKRIGGGWCVSRVAPLRRGDDLVALVLPNGYTYIDSMKNHLGMCSKDGMRSISKIVREFELKIPLTGL